MSKYYEVFVAVQSYQKQDPLTYSFDGELAAGAVIGVPFGRKTVPGFVVRSVEQPSFTTKPILGQLVDGLLPDQTRKLFTWLQGYYPSGSGPALQLFMPANLLTIKEPSPAALAKQAKTAASTATTAIAKKSKPALEADELPPLTPEQQIVIATMDAAPKKHFLLHGETGSGKTRVYIERALRCLAAGRSAVILTPEIALTPQIATVFKRTFGSQVIVMHSGLTATIRRKLWLRALDSFMPGSKPLVIIGARSALFAPLHNIGLIVVDEMHEPAYKQEQAPRYFALRVAGALAAIHQAEIIYGSATPPIAEYYIAEATKTPILRMRSTARSSHPPAIAEVVDLKQRNAFTKNRYISNTLIDHIVGSLTRGEQSLIYLNRRGTAKLVICQECGWQALCPNCDLPLTYHGDTHTLRCHTCGLQSSVPFNCPDCGSSELLFRSIGTKALVTTLESLFPQARIQRFDTDVAKADTFQQHYEAVHSGAVDILVGTQILAKGLDLPRLSTVGVVSADTSFYLPDFTAAERSYQLLYQVLGRVGRGHIAGSVVVQTFTPDSPVLRAAINRDWKGFYQSQIEERRSFLFPPFCYVLKLMSSRITPDGALHAIERLHTALRAATPRTAAQIGLRIQFSDPMPRFYEHTHGQYHWQLIIKSTRRPELIKALQILPAGDWTYDLDPANLL